LGEILLIWVTQDYKELVHNVLHCWVPSVAKWRSLFLSEILTP